MIYLASSSPRRKELLQQMGVLFEVVPQFADESHISGESPETYVSRLALEKAYDALSRQKNKQIPVLGSDTAVILNGTILGKPENKEHAVEMLLSLSDKTHQVLSAVALVNKDKEKLIVSTTEVSFTKLSRTICEQYWYSGEPADKAGSYGIQGLGALFVRNINGSYSGVMGLPVYETQLLLKQFSINLL